MYKTRMQVLALGVFLLVGCAGQTKPNTAYDANAESGEAAPEHTIPAEEKMPEPPKIKADDMGR